MDLLPIVFGILLAPANQAIIEHTLANKAWMPTALKALLPSLISTGLALLAVKFGINPADAIAAAAALAGSTHVVNETHLAADSAQS